MLVDHNSVRDRNALSARLEDASSSALPSALKKTPFVRFTSDAVDANTYFDQDDSMLPDSFDDLPPLRRMYSDSHSFMDGALSGQGSTDSDNTSSQRMCSLPDLTRFKAVDDDDCAPLTVAGGSSASSKGGNVEPDLAVGSVYCYTTKQLESILASIVAQTADQFEISVGQAGTQQLLYIYLYSILHQVFRHCNLCQSRVHACTRI